MSTAKWGTCDLEIKIEKVKELCPTELLDFMATIGAEGIDFDMYAKYRCTMDPEYVDDGHDDIEHSIEEANIAFSELQDKMKQQHNIEIELFAGTADIEFGEDRGYFVVDNAMIWNPEISADIRKDLSRIQIVQVDINESTTDDSLRNQASDKLGWTKLTVDEIDETRGIVFVSNRDKSVKGFPLYVKDIA